MNNTFDRKMFSDYLKFTLLLFVTIEYRLKVLLKNKKEKVCYYI